MNEAEQQDLKELEEQAQMFEADAMAERAFALSAPDPKFTAIQHQMIKSREEAALKAMELESLAQWLRRIIGYMEERAPDEFEREYVMELEEVICDALQTLENEQHAGTQFNQPAWVLSTLAALHSVKRTMDASPPE